MMVSQFKSNAQSIGLPAAAARAQESQAGIITVASLIEAEGKLPQDYPKIAEVIYNRLNMNPPMKLQLDTTVLYAMSLAHRKGFSANFASPYNTYLHANLPPGPIDNPGNLAIQAALRPAHGGLLYFLTINSNSGKTLFFSTARPSTTRSRSTEVPGTPAPDRIPARAEREDHESRGPRLAHRPLTVAGPAPGGVPGARPGRMVLPGDRVR